MGCRALVLVIIVLTAVACSGADRTIDDADLNPDSDSDRDAAADGDADSDADDAGDAWRWPDSDIEDPHQVPTCGDGVIDEGEQCDDHNRLNGDGCDWLCRLGDGEPPPTEPDPAVTEVEVDGEPISVGDTPDPETDNIVDLPLVWTGENLATAFQESHDIEDPHYSLRARFRRLTSEGLLLEPEWTHELEGVAVGIDLVWSGDGYGFFFADSGTGVYFLWLDDEMKPTGAPLLVVEEPRVAEIAADWNGENFVLLWVVFTDRERPACHDPSGTDAVAETWARLIGPRGQREGRVGPTLVDDWSEWHQSPDVAADGEGFLLLTFPGATEEHPECAAQLLRLDGELFVEHSSGSLSESSGGSVIPSGDGFVAAWSRSGLRREAPPSICQVAIDHEGYLESAPLCLSPDIDETAEFLYPTRIATDGVGLLRVFQVFRRSLPDQLWAQQTDRRGVPVGTTIRLAEESVGYAVSRVDRGFGVLFMGGDTGTSHGSSHRAELGFHRLTPVE